MGIVKSDVEVNLDFVMDDSLVAGMTDSPENVREES